MSLKWKLHRLSAMSGWEVGYRVKQRVQASVEQLGLHSTAPPPPARNETGAAWVATLPTEFNVDKYRRAADSILDGRFPVFALTAAPLGFPPQWNRDPKTGRQAPLRFGKTLNYRDESLVGDIKYLWEPSRHSQLVTLAQAWHLTREDKYAQGCRTLLESWFDQCPYPSGVHWTSSLEHSIRLVNWSFAWHLLGADAATIFQGAAGEGFKRRWLTSVYQHCQFIAGHFSKYSSANNHLLGELMGLFVASLTWPLWKRSRRWKEHAQRELEREMLLQNGQDGVNREQANWYHHEVADMMIVSGLLARANGCDFSTAYWLRLRGMLQYIASIMDAGGHVPNFGDADDAIIARLDPEPSDVYRSLLATGAVLFDSAEFKFKSSSLSGSAPDRVFGNIDDKTRWLLGDAAAIRFEAIDMSRVSLPARLDFPNAGYYILGDRFETAREVRIVADAGPLGYLSIAAHGHADALSFTLSAAGKEILIDPGTYAYHTQRVWRDYFKGTSAHNTIRVDGVDQSVSGGNFLWIKHAQAQVLAVERTPLADRWVASHDGYSRLKHPVIHRRELLFHKQQTRLQVTDELLGAGVHEVEMFWHFAEQCAVVANGRGVRVSCGDVLLSMTLPEELHCNVHRGIERPEPTGWISRSFDSKAPTTTVIAKGRIDGGVRLVTRFNFDFRS
ncbi:alginate lyase family protein [Steroidobacter sp. S1-65]|uniref:Alginate lyase family protein n=1 Tax=Steroidobacter gossypii TaxID=2805490 RepID=A0ABS1X489_9GAMM|nr:alginate lyase family protein [Steroidobacter gossypii]MBM0108012.1 alginate lyase family protein [Steroidobacter gossypii]